MSKAHTVFPGHFVKTTLLSRKFEVGDPRCYLCASATCGPFYVRIPLEEGKLVCRRCMGDPWLNGAAMSRTLDTTERFSRW